MKAGYLKPEQEATNARWAGRADFSELIEAVRAEAALPPALLAADARRYCGLSRTG
ncbi:hypothetical protein [Gemmata massiliana]|uniref:hypothetical protein n=1 Tax=Gemmata massiliana TaxID=1210884 RepID=UPI0013A6E4DA|nr:hypothetical protein [Gemmata massiliana]